jgi:hypothetical protein
MQLYITIDVQDVQEGYKTNLENVDGHGKLSFSGATVGSQNYELDLLLMNEIIVETSKICVSGRNVFVMLMKKEAGHWPRLTKDTGKHLSHIKCDWNKWIDEDDEEGGADKFDFSQHNFSGFGDEGEGPPGLSAAADEDEDDSDNEELPDLVK